jgi:hypothetical protein
MRLFAAILGVVALMATAPRDNAVIVDSGSTNAPGYNIQVWSDGSSSVTSQARGASPGPARSFTVPAATATRFFADLDAARKGNVVTVPCMKSVSFGSTVRITWQGWTSPDLTCPPKDSLGEALIADVNDIRKAAGLTGI